MATKRPKAYCDYPSTSRNKEKEKMGQNCVSLKGTEYKANTKVKIQEPAVSTVSSPVLLFTNSFPGLLNPFPLAEVSSLSLSEESIEPICRRNKNKSWSQTSVFLHHPIQANFVRPFGFNASVTGVD